jgi:hypothetical protein
MVSAQAEEIITGADDDAQKILSQLASQGMQIGNLKEMPADDGTVRGADVYVTLHHAFGKRAWRGPAYMASGEGGANSLLKYRFSSEEVRLNSYDPKWIGKRVWYADKQPVSDPVDTELRCPLSAHNPDDIQAAVRASGFVANCRRGKSDVIFETQDKVDFHVEKRHPRYKVAAERAEERTRAQEQSEFNKRMMETMAALVEREASPTKRTEK